MVETPYSTPMTRDGFERFAMLPANRDRRFEFINDEVIEIVSGGTASWLTARLLRHLAAFVDDHDLGFCTGADGGYRIGADDMIPDLAFASKQKRARPSDESYQSVVPDLVVEVQSPTDRYRPPVGKATRYLEAGVAQVWIVRPAQRAVEVLTHDDTVILREGDMLAGFQLAVSALFAGMD
jgi:Uma2 family endonuclease